jgi:hypothetical protein
MAQLAGHVLQSAVLPGPLDSSSGGFEPHPHPHPQLVLPHHSDTSLVFPHLRPKCPENKRRGSRRENGQ